MLLRKKRLLYCGTAMVIFISKAALGVGSRKAEPSIGALSSYESRRWKQSSVAGWEVSLLGREQGSTPCRPLRCRNIALDNRLKSRVSELESVWDFRDLFHSVELLRTRRQCGRLGSPHDVCFLCSPGNRNNAFDSVFVDGSKVEAS